MYSTEPTTPVVAVVTAAELADWLGVDAGDTLLPIMANAATSAVIEYVQHELISRERVVTYQSWPHVGTVTGRTLSPSNAALINTVKLPYALNAVVSEVKLYNELSTDYIIQDLKPSQVQFDTVSVLSDDDFPAILITYTSGYGVIDDVPDALKVGTLMLAAFMYEHRGECAADQIINKSGAASYLAPFRFNAVVM